jgi:hypothetical protein
MQPVLGDAPADRFLHELARRARSILGRRLLGIWVINSGARDDYLPGSSDLDITIGVTMQLDEATKDLLADALRHPALPCPAPRLELVVYRRAVLADPGPRPAFELNLNTGPEIADHVTGDPVDEPPHWFVLDLAAARERSRVVVGPPLGGLIGPIADAVVITALRDAAAWHDAHDTAAPNRVLNACRAWRWLETRRWSSKTEAAEWAIEAGGDEALIRLALARRRGETNRSLPRARVGSFAARVEERLLASSLPRSRSVSVTGGMAERQGRGGARPSGGT